MSMLCLVFGIGNVLFSAAAVSLTLNIEGRKLAITHLVTLNFHWIISIFVYTFDIKNDNNQLIKVS